MSRMSGPPEAIIPSVNIYFRRTPFTLFVGNRSLKRDKRARAGQAVLGKLRIGLNVIGELFAKKTAGADDKTSPSQSLYNQVAKTGTNGITNKQGTGKHRDCGGHTQNHSKVCAPVVKKTLLY